jgi:hypothetical protein
MEPDDDVEIVTCLAEGDGSSSEFVLETMAGRAGRVVVYYRILQPQTLPRSALGH